MTQTDANNGTTPLDQPIDLLHYVYLLFDRKWIILLGSLLCGYATLLYANSLPDISIMSGVCLRRLSEGQGEAPPGPPI